VTPAKVQAALLEMDTLAGEALQKTGVPGMAVVVVYQDQVVYLKGFGVREAGKLELVTPDTVFQLASLSKPIGSTVVAALVGEGTVSWDDAVVTDLPDFQLDAPYVTQHVTIRDLLSHRSGLPDHVGDLLEDMGYSREEILRRLRYVSTANHFRSHYAYTNFGYTAAAVAAAHAAGRSWEDLAAERLFRPLGMNSTSSRYADYLAAKDRAVGHVRENGKWDAKYRRDTDAQAPAGGVSSSVRDLAQGVRLQLGGGTIDGKPIVRGEALAETHRPQVISVAPKDAATDRASFYGLGWNVNYDEQGRVRLGHSGAFNLGAATAVYLLPADQLGVVVLTNGSPIGVPESVILSFLDIVLEGKVTRDWLAFLGPIFAAMDAPAYGTAVDYSKPPAHPAPAAPLDAYVGSYHSDYFGDIEISAENGGLVMRQGPKRTAFPMKHWDRDVFLYQPVGEQAGGLSGVTFMVGPGHKARRVIVENLNTEGEGQGLGVFTRDPADR
jgi:CubicO group peptidase (beta-lactamase class C family)